MTFEERVKALEEAVEELQKEIQAIIQRIRNINVRPRGPYEGHGDEWQGPKWP